MAIIQISKIQHRRGRAEGVALPQLASGEIGWAIDTQELYIGNGAVSEGAPAVGNTQILTENTNIFELADQYSYKPGSNFWNGLPVTRSLQSKLDDVVSVFDFDATGDGTDQTTAIQSAIDKLYKNADESIRVILRFPAGNYTITAPLVIPPFATLRGAGKGKTVILADNCNLFTTTYYDPADPSAPAPTTNTQARYIEISGMSLVVNSADHKAMVLNSVKHSVFKNLRIEGVFPESKNFLTAESVYGSHSAIELNSSTNTVICQTNIFDNIEIDSFYYGVYSDYDMMYNSFSLCSFYLLSNAFRFGKNTTIPSIAMNFGAKFNTIENSYFDRIDKTAIHIDYGDYNTSRENRFFNVGNFGGTEGLDAVAIIDFPSHTNVEDNDYFERSDALSTDAIASYVPEVSGRVFYKGSYLNTITIGTLPVETKILQFPVIEGTMFIDYVYTDKPGDSSNTVNVLKEGTIEIVCAINADTPSIIVNDEFNFVGDVLLTDALSFDAEYTSDSTTVNLLAINTITVDTDSFLYNLRVKSN
jgi:hypothetical protein